MKVKITVGRFLNRLDAARLKIADKLYNINFYMINRDFQVEGLQTVKNHDLNFALLSFHFFASLLA